MDSYRDFGPEPGTYEDNTPDVSLSNIFTEKGAVVSVSEKHIGCMICSELVSGSS
jgi:hypothetical protein